MIGIRREDKNRWERRAPLTPDHVAQLTRIHGVLVAVQPFPLRAFADVDYETAGAQVSESLAMCDVILGIKEVPAEKVIPGKTYLFFSHTTKGQLYNMPMLRRLIEKGCTLIDFELIVDRHGRRLIFFGRHAGYAGMIDALWALGQRLHHEGHTTPFERLRRAHEYTSLDEATQHVSRVGERLRHVGLPDGLRPIVVGFTGSGNVSRGAQEILDRLPTLELLPEELEQIGDDPDRPRNVIYKVVLDRAHRYRRSPAGAFDAAELAEHPGRYVSAMPRWLPWLTVLVHGAYWNPDQPRLIGVDDLRRLWQERPHPRLRVIADISCDIKGGIEATVRATSPGEPVFVYRVDDGQTPSGFEGRGPVMLAVDNLPCELPAEASEHFGDTLLRFVPVLDRCDWGRPLDELAIPEELRRAVVLHRGRLTPGFSYLEEYLDRA